LFALGGERLGVWEPLPSTPPSAVSQQPKQDRSTRRQRERERQANPSTQSAPKPPVRARTAFLVASVAAALALLTSLVETRGSSLREGIALRRGALEGITILQPDAVRDVRDGAVVRLSSLAWLAVSSFWAAASALVVAIDANPVFRAPVVLSFLLIGPGLAIVRLLGIPAATAQLSLGIALSMALDVLVPAALLYAGAWSPSSALAILVALTIAAALVEVVLDAVAAANQVGDRRASR
jgi:hypothetical protein